MIMAERLSDSLMLMVPELIIAGAALVLILYGVFVGERSARQVSVFAMLAMLIAAFAVVLVGPSGDAGAFGGSYANDGLSRLAKIVILGAGFIGLWLSGRYLISEKLDRFEYPILILFAVLGMMVMASSRDLMLLYIGIELQSLSLYVLAAYNRDSTRASEAGLKYFVLGALSSGMLLYGASMIYGFAGSTGFSEIAAAASQDNAQRIGLVFGLVFLLSGLAFKVSAAPFHMWTPDVYEGAPTPVTAFFAAAPKFAAMVLIARTLYDAFPALEADWQQVVAAMAVLSMFVGALGALGQNNIKRLLAYSSIANMGFALVPLVSGTQRGLEGMLIFMTIYVISVIAVFAIVLGMRKSTGMVENVNDLAGLSRVQPWTATCLTVLMFSIAGIPPLAGFLAKFYAFIPALESGFVWLAILGVLASVIAAVYYLRLVKVMWFDEPPMEPLERLNGELGVVSSVGALMLFPVLILPIVAPAGRAWIGQAAQSLF
jgi:NADH-quinone oxidoreductase subunit N